MKTTHQKIFVVDDEPLMRQTIGDALSESGYDVTCFANADSCLSEIAKKGCNLLISDVKMPGIDGIELLRRMKRLAPWIPVILITGYGSIEMAVYAVKIGATDFIEKPFNRKTLINKITEVLSYNEYVNHPDTSKLTKTEKKVLKLILDGCSNKEIALKIGCALRTVEFHRTHIYRKFGVNNAVDLTKKAMSMFSNDKSSINIDFI